MPVNQNNSPPIDQQLDDRSRKIWPMNLLRKCRKGEAVFHADTFSPSYLFAKRRLRIVWVGTNRGLPLQAPPRRLVSGRSLRSSYSGGTRTGRPLHRDRIQLGTRRRSVAISAAHPSPVRLSLPNNADSADYRAPACPATFLLPAR